jgi:hypothetical protein
MGQKDDHSALALAFSVGEADVNLARFDFGQVGAQVNDSSLSTQAPALTFQR